MIQPTILLLLRSLCGILESARIISLTKVNEMTVSVTITNSGNLDNDMVLALAEMKLFETLRKEFLYTA